MPALALLVLCVSACATDPQDQVAALIARGDAYVAAKQFAEASIEYRRALQTTPAAASVHYKLALAYEKLNRNSDAVRELIRVTELVAWHRDANLRVARLFMVNGRFEDADRLAGRVLDDDPRDVDGLTLSARIARAAGRKGESDRRIQAALSVDPSSAEALRTHAAFDAQEGRIPEARLTLHQALSAHPTAVDAWIDLALIEWHALQFAEAERALKQAVAVDETATEPRRLLAAFYMQTAQLDRAKSHLVALASTSPLDQLRLAEYLVRQGAMKEAQPHLDRLLSEPSVAGEVRLLRSLVAEMNGRPDDAIRELEHAAKDSKVASRAGLLRSYFLLSQGNGIAALEEARRMTTAQPDSADAQYAVGIVQRELGDAVEAERAFERARQSTALAQAIDGELVLTALAQGHAERALAIASKLAQATPGPQTIALFARALRQSGHVNDADVLLRGAATKWPRSANLQIELAETQLASGRLAAARTTAGDLAALLGETPSRNDGHHGVDPFVRQALQRIGGRNWAAEPGEPEVLVLQSRVAAALGEPARAEAILQTLLAKYANEVDVREAVGGIYLSLGNKADAKSHLDWVLAHRPRSVRILTIVGLLCEENGDVATAEALYRRAVSSEQNAGVAANNLAWLLAARAELPEALAMAKTAEQHLQSAPVALDTLGWMHHLMGDHASAIRFLTVARDRVPRSGVYRYHLGAALADAGRRPEAEVELRLAMKLKPGSKESADARNLLIALGTRQPPATAVAAPTDLPLK